ncbi:MAG: hypothetical protein O3A00_25825, partial [Planctomycetota bacterium]|nr:hypothetical protein [Planctomycetota bacterium]
MKQNTLHACSEQIPFESPIEFTRDETEQMATTIKAGTPVRIRAGITAPDLPDFSIGGWTGTVAEVKGRGEKQRFFVQWDEGTLAKMSPEYLQECED